MNRVFRPNKQTQMKQNKHERKILEAKTETKRISSRVPNWKQNPKSQTPVAIKSQLALSFLTSDLISTRIFISFDQTWLFFILYCSLCSVTRSLASPAGNDSQQSIMGYYFILPCLKKKHMKL